MRRSPLKASLNKAVGLLQRCQLCWIGGVLLNQFLILIYGIPGGGAAVLYIFQTLLAACHIHHERPCRIRILGSVRYGNVPVSQGCGLSCRTVRRRCKCYLVINLGLLRVRNCRGNGGRIQPHGCLA